MTMSPKVMYLILAAIVAILFFMFVIPEMKSRGKAPHTLVHNINALADDSLTTNQTHDLGAQLFGKLVGSSKGFHDQLYAIGGGYDTFEVPYGKDETDDILGKKSKSISGGSSWEKDFEKANADHNGHVALIPERHHFYSPYDVNDEHFTKSHGVLPAKWEKKFTHHSSGKDIVTHHSGKHAGPAGHGEHSAHN